MYEVTRNLETRLGLAPTKIAHLIAQVNEHFPEAMVTGYEKMTARMTNHPKDRHVLAAGVRCRARFIVTSNLKDFPSRSLENLRMEAVHPDEFLMRLYEREPAIVVAKLQDQAATIQRDLGQILTTLRAAVPKFAAMVAESTRLEKF